MANSRRLERRNFLGLAAVTPFALTSLACGQDERVGTTPYENSNNPLPSPEPRRNPFETIWNSEIEEAGTSLQGTKIERLTNGRPGRHRRLIYAEPRWESPDLGYFLFWSRQRNPEQDELTLMNLDETSPDYGKMYPVLVPGHEGFNPAWIEGEPHAFLHGKLSHLLEIDALTNQRRNIELPVEGMNSPARQCETRRKDCYCLSFIAVSQDGEYAAFVEEDAYPSTRPDGNRDSYHRRLSMIRRDGTDYRVLANADDNVKFFDRPIWIVENGEPKLLYLTRGENRNPDGNFNNPWITDLKGNKRQFSMPSSHYDVNHARGLIVSGQDGYVLDFNENILFDYSHLMHGHATWIDETRFLATADPDTNPSPEYAGKIIVFDYERDMCYDLVEHGNPYRSSSVFHNQPDAQTGRDARYIYYNSGDETKETVNIFRVEIPETPQWIAVPRP